MLSSPAGERRHELDFVAGAEAHGLVLFARDRLAVQLDEYSRPQRKRLEERPRVARPAEARTRVPDMQRAE
jgi:hypothetical protein